jgi:hypothetical protein
VAQRYSILYLGGRCPREDTSTRGHGDTSPRLQPPAAYVALGLSLGAHPQLFSNRTSEHHKFIFTKASIRRSLPGMFHRHPRVPATPCYLPICSEPDMLQFHSTWNSKEGENTKGSRTCENCTHRAVEGHGFHLLFTVTFISALTNPEAFGHGFSNRWSEPISGP